MSEAILPIDHTRLAALKAGWQAKLDYLKDIECTPERVQWFTDRLNEAQAAIKAHDEERKVLSAPIFKDFTAVNEAYKEAIEPVVGLKAVLAEALGRAAMAERAAQEAARTAALTAATLGDVEACQTALASIPETTKAKGAGTRFRWVHTVVDRSKVPDDYWAIDEALLEAAGKAFDKREAPPNIPGVAWARVATVQPRGRK